MESLVTYNIFFNCSMLRCRYLNCMPVIVPTYCLLALMGLNKDEAIYKLIFGISIYGTA